MHAIDCPNEPIAATGTCQPFGQAVPAARAATFRPGTRRC